MMSNVVTAWQALMKRREEAAAALAAIDREIAEVRELLGGGGAPAAAAKKPRRQGESKVRPSSRAKREKSKPAPKPAAAPDAKESDVDERIVRQLATGPKATSELVAACKLSEYAVRTACQRLEQAGILTRLGTGPRNSRWAITAKEIKTAARTNGASRKATTTTSPSGMGVRV